MYPEQDKELSIDDIYKQYSVFFDFMESVPDYIEVFVMPGTTTRSRGPSRSRR